MRFRQIEDHREVWPVRIMCAALSVSPSGYYAWRLRPQSPRKIANRALLGDIQRVHARHRGRYGAPRIHAELRPMQEAFRDNHALQCVPRAKPPAASGSSG